MIIGPKGQILAEAETSGDSLGGSTQDFRARLFRERNPAAYRILTDDHPPALDRLKDVPVPSAAEGITTGTERFYEAERLHKEGQIDAAREIFADLGERFGTLWMGTAARQRLVAIDQDDREE